MSRRLGNKTMEIWYFQMVWQAKFGAKFSAKFWAFVVLGCSEQKKTSAKPPAQNSHGTMHSKTGEIQGEIS